LIKLTWKEVSVTERIVIRKKTFKTEAAFNYFVKELFKRDNFLGIILAG